MLSICICINIYIDYHKLVLDEISVYGKMRDLRLKNPKKVTIGHLNINSIPNKFEGIMELVKENLDIFLISEIKIDSSFPDAQFFSQGYSKPHRKDRCLGGGGLLMNFNENIPLRILNAHVIPGDIEILCVDLNKKKWVIIGIYRPPDMNELYFIDNLSRAIDYYSKGYESHHYGRF